MEKSFEFVRQLIEAGRYKNFKEVFWGGADVIFVSPDELDKPKQKYGITLREQLKTWMNDAHLLVETKYASAVIWLIETLKAYVDVDYLSKYEYYRNIGLCVINYEDINNEKELLLKILDDEQISKWKKKRINIDKDREDISKFKWKEWYRFGIENNDPFFVKFMFLWIAFNQIYSKFSGEAENQKTKEKYHSERKQIIECLEKDIETRLLTEKLFSNIFNSPFIQIFKEKSIDVFDRTHMVFVPDSRHKDNETVASEEKDWKERIKALFMMVYQVRCNLFHGSKEISNARDVKLVQCAGEILEMYLEGTSQSASYEYSMVFDKDIE